MAMKIINVGDVVGAADMNEFFVNTKYVEKAAGTTRTSTTTPANDPDLQLQIDANKTYWMELIAPFTSPAAAGFKFSFSVPAGSVFTGYVLYTGGLGTPSMFIYSSAGNAITFNVISGSGGGGVDDIVVVTGTLDTAGTAGKIIYQWAQNTSNAGNTIVRAGSAMLVRRVS